MNIEAVFGVCLKQQQMRSDSENFGPVLQNPTYRHEMIALKNLSKDTKIIILPLVKRG